jgi:hypothetical protein
MIAATCCPSSNSPPGAAATTPVASIPSTRGKVEQQQMSDYVSRLLTSIDQGEGT